MEQGTSNMQIHRSLYAQAPVALLAASLCLLRQGSAQDALHGWKTEARTAAIELVGVEEGPSMMFLLKNVSTTPIMTIAVSFDGGVSYDLNDYFETPTVLQPGTTHSLSVPDRHWPEKTLTLMAVVFASGAAEGQQDAIAFVRARHLGIALEMERVKGILDEVQLRAGQGPDDGALERIAARIGTGPNSPAEAFDAVRDIRMPGTDPAAVKSAGDLVIGGFYSGVRAVRMIAQDNLKQLRQMPATRSGPPTRLDLFSEWRQFCADRSARYRRWLEVLGGMR